MSVNNSNNSIIVSDTTLKLSQAESSVDSNSTTVSLFEQHLLPVQHTQPQLHPPQSDFWPAAILTGLYLMFIWIYVANRKKITQMISAFYLNRFNNLLSRDEFTIGNRVAVFLSLFFIVANTIFIVHLLSYLKVNFPFNTLVLSSLIGGGLLILYAGKMILINVFGYVFQVQKEASEYARLVFLYCNLLGLFMLPLSVCVVFMKQFSPAIFITAGVSMISIFILVRIIRGLFVGLNSTRISKLYLFVYLCTLEIMPFVILAKLFMLN